MAYNPPPPTCYNTSPGLDVGGHPSDARVEKQESPTTRLLVAMEQLQKQVAALEEHFSPVLGPRAANAIVDKHGEPTRITSSYRSSIDASVAMARDTLMALRELMDRFDL